MSSRFSELALPSFIVRYGTAVLAVGAALGLTAAMWHFVKPLASPLFLVAIIITSWKRGLSAGIVATFLSGLIIDYIFIAPQYQLSGNADDITRLFFFTLEGVVLCWLVAWRTKAAEEISNSREHLQALSLRQQNLLEDERKRIALEIHDELGQSLTGLKMEMHLLNRQIDEIDGLEKSRAASEKIKELLNLTDNTILTVRRIATELRPPILDDLGLSAAIEWQAQSFGRRTGISCVVSTNFENVEFDADFSIAVFRIFQETLTNIARHAGANTITVNLKKSDRKLILRVEDDGKGFQEETGENQSLGILGMHERARLIGGELKVYNGEENGAVILLTAPIRQN